MHVLHVVHNYDPAIGGVEWLIKNLSEGLSRRGHSVHVISSNATSCEPYVFRTQAHLLLKAGEEVLQGVRVSRVSFYGGSSLIVRVLRILGNLFWSFRLPFHGFIRALWQGPLSFKMFLKVLKAPCDIMVASPLPTLNVMYAYLAAKMRRKPLVIIPCFHVEDPWSFDRKPYYRMLKQAERVIALTEYEKRFLVSKGVAAERIDVRGVGISIEEAAAKTDYREK
jgi:glycosyltransferase involved in cell wall biosynthesis